MVMVLVLLLLLLLVLHQLLQFDFVIINKATLVALMCT